MNNEDILYQSYHAEIVFGFHGCDENVCKEILNSTDKHLTWSTNDYDWLGDGIYFWLNDPTRALEWAIKNLKVSKPAVIGAIIRLGNCLDFNERANIKLLQTYYKEMEKDVHANGLTLKKNHMCDNGGYPLVRELDCAVIRYIHEDFDKNKSYKFDTVMGTFLEGEAAYPSAGFNTKTHTQICVRNTSCIIGYFLPRTLM